MSRLHFGWELSTAVPAERVTLRSESSIGCWSRLRYWDKEYEDKTLSFGVGMEALPG